MVSCLLREGPERGGTLAHTLSLGCWGQDRLLETSQRPDSGRMRVCSFPLTLPVTQQAAEGKLCIDFLQPFLGSALSQNHVRNLFPGAMGLEDRGPTGSRHYRKSLSLPWTLSESRICLQ